jgi:DNA polymerase I-like protein with 3'-5' exonuclease and polymerase domains
MQLVFDIETNGLLPDVNTLHVCCTYDLDTKEEWYSTDPDEILSHLSKATHLIGHNIIDYDLPALEKLTGWKPNEDTRITDTLILSRLGNPDRSRHPSHTKDGYKAGPHSLGAWGYRIGVGKPDHEDWSTYSEDMLHRCREDVRINSRILPILIEETKDFGDSIRIEQEVQRIISRQERTGVYFDSETAVKHIDELSARVESINARLMGQLPRHARQVGATINRPFKKDGSLSKMAADWWIVDYLDDPGFDRVSYYTNLTAGPFSRIEWIMTDLNSDKQVKEWLLSIGWKPTEWNTSKLTGERTSPKLTPESFASLPGGLGEQLKERVTWRHRASQIQGWVDRCRVDHCLSAGANPLGTNTGRMRHRTVVNVPKAADFIPFGKEMRSLFCARPGRKFIGHDASGLELRMLAHYMNDKEFTEQVLHGDIHSYNQRLAGLPTRDSAKTFIYAFIYGAGDAKLGSIIDGSKADGTKLRNKFLSALPKLGQLIDQVKRASRRGYLIGLDGRKIMMRKQSDGSVMEHKALNTLLQCAGAVVMKQSIIYLDRWARDLDAMKVIDMHDEGQADVSVKDSELYAELAVKSIIQAGIYFNLNIPLDAEAKIGTNWAETH